MFLLRGMALFRTVKSVKKNGLTTRRQKVQILMYHEDLKERNRKSIDLIFEGTENGSGRENTSGQLVSQSRHPGDKRTSELRCSRLLALHGKGVCLHGIFN